MRSNKSKVAVVGMGAVGSATAFSLIIQGVCAEVMLIDSNREKAEGEMLDFQHSIEYLNRNVHVYVGDYAQCQDADIVIITAAKNGITKNRLDALEATAGIVKSIVEPIMASGFDGHFIVVSNPVDIMSYYVHKLSGLPKNQVIGTGTALDSARLKHIIGQLLEMDPRSVEAYCMGEHGDSQMVPWSHVRAGGKSFLEILADNPFKYEEVSLSDLLSRTVTAGFEVFSRKNSTQYGIASATTGIVKAILYDENRIIPVSTLLEGEYGVCDVFCGVPAVLNRDGVKEIGEFNLTAEEYEAFEASVAVIKNYITKLPL